jgi:hypothetical protein
LAYHNTGEASYADVAKSHLHTLQLLVEGYAASYDSLELPDPDSKDLFQFGVNVRDSMQHLQQELTAAESYWSTGEASELSASGAINGAYVLMAGELQIEVDPHTFSLMSVRRGDDKNLLDKPISLAIFRVGGLEESGKYVGRTFVSARAKLNTTGEVETTLTFGCQGTELVFLSKSEPAQIEVKCRFADLSPEATVELPCVTHFSSSSAAPIRMMTERP